MSVCGTCSSSGPVAPKLLVPPIFHNYTCSTKTLLVRGSTQSTFMPVTDATGQPVEIAAGKKFTYHSIPPSDTTFCLSDGKTTTAAYTVVTGVPQRNVYFTNNGVSFTEPATTTCGPLAGDHGNMMTWFFTGILILLIIGLIASAVWGGH